MSSPLHALTRLYRSLVGERQISEPLDVPAQPHVMRDAVKVGGLWWPRCACGWQAHSYDAPELAMAAVCWRGAAHVDFEQRLAEWMHEVNTDNLRRLSTIYSVTGWA